MTPAQARLQVVRLENPYAFAELPVMEWLQRWTDTPEKWVILADLHQRQEVEVFGASAHLDRLEGLFILQLPGWNLLTAPHLIFFGCSGGVKLRRKMARTVVETLQEAGYSACITPDGGRALPLAEVVQALTGAKANEPAKKSVRRKQDRPKQLVHAGGHNAGRAARAKAAVRPGVDGRAPAGRKARVARPVRRRNH